LEQLEKSWDMIRYRISDDFKVAEVKRLLELFEDLIKAYVFAGRPILIPSQTHNQRKALIDLFQYGMGIIQSIKNVEEGLYIEISLKEPLVMISGDKVFGVSSNMIKCGPSTIFSSLGFMWKNCVASALVGYARSNNGFVDMCQAFEINEGS
jgi:hypothetical protein